MFMTVKDLGKWEGNNSLESLHTVGIAPLQVLNDLFGEEIKTFDDDISRGEFGSHIDRLEIIQRTFHERLKDIKDTIYRFMDERKNAVNENS